MIDNTEAMEEPLREKILRIMAIASIVICPCLLVLCFTRVITQYERAVILRFGRVTQHSPVGPGKAFTIPWTDKVIYFDLRTQSFSLGQQAILTKDSVTVTIDAVVYFHVADPVFCLLNAEDYEQATELLAGSLVRNILGQFTLTEILANRDAISKAIREEIDKGTLKWGVNVERVEIKDVILPFELQKAMAAEAEGTRVAKAKIIEAEGEIKTAENLMEASRIMVEKPHTILLRYLQAMNYIAGPENTSIFFPFPLELPTHTGQCKQ